ncbi:hypothetical protein CYLTODRAFT_422756 [Cylindrobasidium torrendii FP15055 ss-10]|uniref:Uncharacterized protein n=1 Tax=Cylindrobasidium torrendii FP15055 ss-10 TaxID=1314674 RepID=A0A0D7B9I4_9AGAR|nr:hypothetical protein CYLTODRAFT_422756 [Cylindrobasidium torrendii FP15055 ss-10]
MSPIETLPFEVLQLIFSLLVSSTNQGEYRLGVLPSRIILPFQHTLMKVSRSWRTVAISTPHLWSSIHLIWPSNDPRAPGPVPVVDPAAVRRYVHGALSFSKSAPLDINISDRGWEEVGGLLLVDSHRWRTLSLGCTDPPQQFEFRAMRNHIPMLETFRFLPSSPVLLDGHNAYFKAISEAFEDAPALRRVDFNTQLLPVRFPWGQIVEAGLHYCTTGRTSAMACFDTVRDMLASPAMRKLTVHGDPYIPAGPVINGLHLQELEFGHNAAWSAPLYLPSLRKVAANGDTIKILLDCIQLSRCSLTSLAIILDGISSTLLDEIRSMVFLLGQLQRLEISGYAEVDNLKAFLSPLWQTNALPRLSHLVISLTLEEAEAMHCTRFYRSILHAVGCIITSASTELRTVVVDLCAERFDDDSHALDLNALGNSHELRQLKTSLSRREDITVKIQLMDTCSRGQIFEWEFTSM